MSLSLSDRIIGALMLVFGLLGLYLAARAVDEEIYIFGLSLFIYACLFVLGQIRRHYDTMEGSHHG